MTAPSSAGTHYYGACVDAVTGESDTGNNCSKGHRVTVTAAVAAGTMYWTDGEAGRIQRANLDDSGVGDLVTGLEGPSGLALDPGD